jgi:hypothetical protein
MATFTTRREHSARTRRQHNPASRNRRRGLFLERLEERALLAVAASDGFESGNFSGGSGWVTPSWIVAGDAVVQSSNGPAAGTYHARLRSSTGDLQRAVNVAGLTDVRLKFWSKVSSFEGSDQARVQVSSDGTNWTTLQQFTSAQSDNQYRFYDLAIASPGNTLYVRFDAAMSASNDQWYLDDVQIAHTPPPVNGLISWWTGDGTASDSAGGNDASLVSGATYASGQIGSAFSFDGVDDRVQVADSESLKLTESISVEGWVKATGVANQHGMILFRGDNRGGLDPYWLSVESNGQLVFVVENGTAAAGVSTTMPMNQFIHIAGTLDDATGVMRLYVNGVQMSQTITTVRPFADLDPAYYPGIGIGNHGGYPNTGHNFPFKGLIDELKVYDRALSGEEVLANFQAGKGTLQPIVSVNDATATEGDSSIKYQGNVAFSVDDANMLAFGPDGLLYFSLHSGGAIHRYDAATGTPMPAPGKTGAEFVSPGAAGLNAARSIAFGPDNNLYVASANTDAVLRFDATTGEPVGNGQFIAAGAGGLDQPRGLLFHSDASGSYLYVTSVGGTDPAAGKDAVLRYNALTGDPAGVSGLPGDAVFISSGAGDLDNPSEIVFHDGHFYVTSTNPSTSNSVLKFDANGAFVEPFIPTGGVGGELSGPIELVFRDGYAYVTSWNNDKVLQYDAATGALVSELVSGRGLDRPMGLVFETDGSFLVASGDSDEIRRYGTANYEIFTVSLSAPFPTALSVNYMTADNSALAGSDYESSSGTLQFAPGQRQAIVRVRVLDDLLVESSESHYLNLSNAAGGVIGDGQGVGVLLDDESPASNTKFYVVDSTADRTFEYGSSGQTLAGDDWALASGNADPRGATSNETGSRLWVVNATGAVYAYDNDGNLLGLWTAAGAGQAEGIATDGVNIWIVDAQDDQVLYFAGGALVTSGTVQPTSTFNLAAVNDNPTGITTDGTSIWINDDDKRNEDNIWRYTLAGVFQGGWDLPAANAKAVGITIDPTGASDSIWVVDSGTDQVFEYKGAYGSNFSVPLTLVGTFNLASGNANPTDIADPPVAGEADFAAGPGEPSPRLAGDWVDAVFAAGPEEPDSVRVAATTSAVKVQETWPRPDESSRWRRIQVEEPWSVVAREEQQAEDDDAQAADVAIVSLLEEEG